MFFNFETKKSRSNGEIGLLTMITAVVVMLLTFLPFLGSYFWFFEELVNYRLYTFGVALVMLTIYTFTRSTMLLTGIFFAGVVINGWHLYPSFTMKGVPYSKEPVIKCMSLSLPESELQNDKLMKKLQVDGYDLVLMHKVNKNSQKRLLNLREKYPYQLKTSKWLKNSMVLLSRHPFSYKKVSHSGIGRFPYLNCSVRVNGRQVNVIAVLSPFGSTGGNVKLRNSQIRKLRLQARQSKSALVVMGRFNCAPWHPAMQDAVKYGKLSSGMDVATIKGTFPSFLPSFLALPLDHIMHSGSFIAKDYETVRVDGSSDWAIITKLQFK